jgi:hypothetical protein
LFLEKAKFKKTNPNQILTPAYLILEKVNSNNKSEQILFPPYMSIFHQYPPHIGLPGTKKPQLNHICSELIQNNS